MFYRLLAGILAVLFALSLLLGCGPLLVPATVCAAGFMAMCVGSARTTSATRNRHGKRTGSNLSAARASPQQNFHTDNDNVQIYPTANIYSGRLCQRGPLTFVQSVFLALTATVSHVINMLSGTPSRGFITGRPAYYARDRNEVSATTHIHVHPTNSQINPILAAA